MPGAPENSFEPTKLADWRAWLKRNHTRPLGVWLITRKKGTGRQQFAYDEGVAEALCFGWIDSIARKLDNDRSMLWYAPRKPRTGWSASNKRRVVKPLAEGRMHPAGMAKVEAAKLDGSWNKLNAVEALVVPADLQSALCAAPGATAHFEAFPKSVRRGILEWILNAKKPETRAKRVEETARLAAQNRRANQWTDKTARR